MITIPVVECLAIVEYAKIMARLSPAKRTGVLTMVRRPPLERSEFRREAVQVVVVYARKGMTRRFCLRIFTTPPLPTCRVPVSPADASATIVHDWLTV